MIVLFWQILVRCVWWCKYRLVSCYINHALKIQILQLILRIAIFLVLKSLWGTRKKMKFLVKEQGKFEEFSGLPIYLIYPPKVNKKWCTNFSKKTSKFLEHNFWLPIQFLLHFYALMFCRYQIRLFFFHPKAQF